MFNKIKKINSIVRLDKKSLSGILSNIENYKNQRVVAIYNPKCIGIMNSAKDLFDNLIPMDELVNKEEIEKISEAIANSNITQIVFFSITIGWKTLIEKIHEKNKNIKLKLFWHGSHSLFVMNNESNYFYNVIELIERKILYSVAFAKESMAELYKIKGYNSFFLPNKIPHIEDFSNINVDNNIEKNNDKIKIGLYAAGDRWEKNTFNQLSAAFLIDNSIVDVIPNTKLVKSFCKLMNIELTRSASKHVSRKELFEKMSKNDINLYVTFTECSPVLPLESLELGVPCIIGNNNHYFKNSKLQDYLVVDSEDNIDEIYNKLKNAIENKNEIIRLYEEWKKVYDVFFSKKLQDFLQS